MEDKINIRLIATVLIMLLVQNRNYGQTNTCDSILKSNKTILWTYNCNKNKQLNYTISFCKHNGLHKSRIEITKSDENDTTQIKGILRTDIGYFDSKEVDSTTDSYNYQKDKTIITKSKKIINSIPIKWESWFGLYTVDFFATQVPQITFEGQCIDDEKYRKAMIKIKKSIYKQILKAEELEKIHPHFHLKTHAAWMGAKG